MSCGSCGLGCCGGECGGTCGCCSGDCCSYQDPATLAQWGCYRAPYIYCDDLGPGGPTQPRHASMTGHQLGQIESCAPGEWYNLATGRCEPIPDVIPGYTPPGGEAPQGPGGQPGGVECSYWDYITGNCPTPAPLPQAPGELPGGVPGVVTEEQCAQRANAAKEAGRKQAQAEVVKVAAISAAVSAVVGAGIGYLLGQ